MPDGLVLPLTLPSGTRAVLTYRQDRGVRLHFREGAPEWETQALLQNLLRLLRRRLPVPSSGKGSLPLSWWEEVLARAKDTLATSIGRVTVS